MRHQSFAYVTVGLSACTVLLGACVTRGKYDELKQKYDEAQAQLGERQTQIGTLHQQVAAEQAKVQALSAEIADAKAQLAALTEARTAKEAELAALQAEQQKLNDELANLLKDRSALKESTERLQQALLELNKRKVEAEKRVAEFKNLIDAGKLQVKLVDGRMVLVLPTDVLFDSGSAKLSKEGVSAVKDVTAVLKTLQKRRFQVEGHTDNVPIKTAQYPSNWELSSARALGVVKAMTEAGMSGEALSAAGFGEYRPAARNDSDANKRENRRIEIVLVPDLSMLPGFEELKRVVEGK